MIQPHGWKRWEDVEAPICPVISAQTVKQANMYIECVKEKCVWWDKCKGSEEQRPHGEWIDRSDGGRIIYSFWERYECSKCGSKSENTNFCPNCGADMRNRGDEK